MKIQCILVYDGKPTQAGEELCKLVYEKVTGSKWHECVKQHEIKKQSFSGNPLYETGYQCTCSDAIFSEKPFNIHLNMNPALLTDLNAIHELETILFREKSTREYTTILNIHDDGHDATIAPAYVRLEALATVLGLLNEWTERWSK